MPEIATCACGARVRIPEDLAGRALRCPKCKSILRAAIAPAPAVASITPIATGTGAVCPVCQTEISTADEPTACPECHQAHHRECWDEVGGCGTYGCQRAPAQAKDQPAPEFQTRAWTDTKVCPACKETIKSIALKCRYCGQEFDTVDPLTVADLHGAVVKDVALRQTRQSAGVLFGFSVIGCLAPLMLLISLAWVLPNRKKLERAGPVTLVLGYTSIGVSLLYSVLMLAFWIFGEH